MLRAFCVNSWGLQPTPAPAVAECCSIVFAGVARSFGCWCCVVCIILLRTDGLAGDAVADIDDTRCFKRQFDVVFYGVVLGEHVFKFKGTVNSDYVQDFQHFLEHPICEWMQFIFYAKLKALRDSGNLACSVLLHAMRCDIPFRNFLCKSWNNLSKEMRFNENNEI